jgi:hypothetical protein
VLVVVTLWDAVKPGTVTVRNVPARDRTYNMVSRKVHAPRTV